MCMCTFLRTLYKCNKLMNDRPTLTTAKLLMICTT